VSDRGHMASVRMVESVVSKHSNLEQSAQVRARVGIPEANVEPVDSQEKYAMVASGEADLYLRLPRNIGDQHYVWDHCAGTAIVQAAGGRVTDIDGSPLDFSHGRTLARNQGILVTNGVIHDRILAAIAEVTGASA
jgi:3'-phosphoadenosine 5'-phosphosulfate (PAPS) 3'-phosphatase